MAAAGKRPHQTTLHLAAMLLLVLLCGSVAGCREKYDANGVKKLRLDDFKGPRYRSVHGIIFMEIRFWVNGLEPAGPAGWVKCQIRAANDYNPRLSWIRREIKPSEVLHTLEHEQNHYNINELAVREFQRMADRLVVPREQVFRRLDSLEAAVKSRYNQLQAKFDRQATFSERHHRRWTRWLSEQLKPGVVYESGSGKSP